MNVKDGVMRIMGEKEEYLKMMVKQAEDKSLSAQECQFWAGRLIECQQLSNDIYNELPDE